jgi:hypothetical protein
LKEIFTILLLFLPIALFSQLSVNKVEFGLYKNDTITFKSFDVSNLKIITTDTSINITDGRKSAFKRLATIFKNDNAKFTRLTEVCSDESGRKCLITYCIDKKEANNSIIVCYPFFLTIYHLRLFIV